PPRPAATFDEIDARQRTARFDGATAGLEAAFELMTGARRSLPAGTFVFVCSDFLAPPRPETWLRALGLRWDVVPVVVQDPLWEQSFPPIGGLVVPFSDPVTGRIRPARVSRRDAERLRQQHERRLETLLEEFRSVNLDHILIGDPDPPAVVRAFTDWAEARIAYRRGSW
ncbi:MAG: hypothetical protein ACM3QU_06930, partial [Verrucomicrobiota bacterium]